MKNSLFLASLIKQYWAMQPEVLHAYARIVAGNFAAKGASAIEIDARDGMVSIIGEQGLELRAPTAGPIEAAAMRPQARSAGNNIAVLGLYGPITQRASLMQDMCGGTSCQGFTQAFRSAMADDTVSQILVDIDSPGGSVAGIQELGAEIRAARGVKPVVGVANSTCASGAYWLGSQCSELFCTPSGQVGSIGVIVGHEDLSKAMEAEGIKTTLITYGQFKAEGNSLGPLDEEAVRSIQGMVDSYGADFTNAVAKGRNVPVEQVRSSFGQGRMLRAADAKAVGMVDGIKSFDETVRYMQQSARSQQRANRSALAAARNELDLLT